MASCPRCGAQQSERSAFCTACGALIDRPNTAAPASAGAQEPSGPSVIQGEPLPAETVVAHARPVRAAGRHDFGDIGVYIVRRFLALAVDLAGVGFLIGIGLVASVDAARANPDQFLAAHAQQFAIALGGAIFIYLTIAEALFGSTIGKGLFGLGVGRRDGGRLGFARALVRNIVLPLDLAVIGFFLAAVTPSRARIGDFVAGSVVANARTGRLAIVSAALIGVGAAWLLFANADGARMSSQLLSLAGLRLPVDQGQPEQTPTVQPSSGRPLPAASAQPVPASSPQPRPSPSPSADPGRPI
jgi:uncharacterized RDD family membrane protein YckC